MIYKNLSISALLLAFSFALAGCDVDKTQEGEMPDVDIQTESGQMPKYDVDTPDVDVGTEKKQIEVPDVDVDTETKEIEVPDVDVDMPKE
ncbi:hypothetical protein [Nitrosococcus watsonii]|uniref:Transmembrane prediction n=1 Tax=Nitrosococcus watsoni (strain C-113) TaxID=105559 RepID=D8K8W5_NITWC|nr:hypothetical protein [Nitrosococcus watsonii]ADJ27175.1 transmembrane prediction [Nitrosococcus watsonii C-113]